HGVGVTCVNFLSEWFRVRVRRGGKIYEQSYTQGVPDGLVRQFGTSDQPGTRIVFKPDGEAVQLVKCRCVTLSQRRRELAFVNAGLRSQVRDVRTGKAHDLKCDGGIASFGEFLNRCETVLHDEAIFLSATSEGVSLVVALQ